MRPFIFTLITLCCWPVTTSAQCDDSLRPSENAALSYRTRGNRCEGFYRANVSASSLALVSCTRGDFSFTPENGELITLSLPAGIQGSIDVRAQGIPTTLYYRMDARLAPGETLRWSPADVLLKDERTARPSNIGLLAFRGSGQDRVYYPLVARSRIQPATTTGRQPAILKFMGSQRIAHFQWRLNNGQWKPLTGPFLSGRAISLSLPEELPGGRHVLEIEYRNLNAAEPVRRRYNLHL